MTVKRIEDRRFIPARTGNRTLVCSPMRGMGSCVRGTGRGSDEKLRRQRFIPARAGNSLPLGLAHSVVSVHPRECGEQDCKSLS